MVSFAIFFIASLLSHHDSLDKDLGSGTTLDLTIPIGQPISELYNVEAELFVDPKKPVKFSYLEKDGYEKLELGQDENTLVGKLLSEHTLKFKGCLYMRLTVIQDETKAAENIGRSLPTSTRINFV